MPTDTMEARPHPDSLFDSSTLKLAYCDLLADSVLDGLALAGDGEGVT